jgi:transposase
LNRPRQWGACWVFSQVWDLLGLDGFWNTRLPPSREGTSWRDVLKVLTAYRLIDPGSEWRLHREWFDRSAMGDLLGCDYSVAAKDTLYRCLDKLVEHKRDLFSFLHGRWTDLFQVTYEVLLYDLTSTYFESNPPFPEGDPRRYGYSRDHRSDCVQVVIALVVTPEGLPLAYEVLSGNTTDNTTLEEFLKKIETQYGKAQRIWLMDRGIPTEETLQQMRQSDPPTSYVVGTPKGRLSRLESKLADQEWQQARERVKVKLLNEDGELYVYVQSQDRIGKERSMRRRRLKKLWKRLQALQKQRPCYSTLLLKLGAEKQAAGRAWGLVEVTLPDPPPRVQRSQRVDFTFCLRKDKLREVRRREGRYLLRSNLTESDPTRLWEMYLRLVEIEAAFKNLKGDLAIRPIYHQDAARIEAHIFVCFLAYCLHVTLRQLMKPHAPGLTVRQLLDKFSTLQMLDVHFPTTDGRTLVMSRYTQPEHEHNMMLHCLNWNLPAQPKPRISAKRDITM